MSQVAENVNTSNMVSLYVGDLKPEINEQALWNVFNPYGQVVSVRICRDAQTQASLRYAYVNFRTNNEAEKALKAVNFALIDGRPCRVMWSMRDSNRRKKGIGNIFIKNIHPGIDSKNLYDAFSHFGSILSCKVAVDDNGFSKGYGFIQFYSDKDAEAARKKSDGVVFKGKKLCVANFVPKSQRTDAKTVDPDDFTNVFIKNFPIDWTEEKLREIFSKYGEITSIFLGQENLIKDSGYSFINFAHSADARRAIHELHDKEISEGRKWFVSRAQKKRERLAYLKNQYEQRKKEIYQKTLERNVYVKNLDDSITDEKFRTMFERFGQIESCQVMKDDNQKSKGFGFVCFTTVEEAKSAIENMNGSVIENKPLYVGIAQSREERKKILDQRAYNSNFRPPMFNPPGGMHFMYSAPGNPVQPIPYSAQNYPRYSNVGQTRGQSRMVQPINHGMVSQGYPQQSGRGHMGYSQGYSNGPHQRPRGSSQYGGHRYSVHNQGQNYQSRPSHQQHIVNVNSVPVENARTRPQIEKVHQQPKSSANPDSKTVFKDKIFTLTKKVASEKKFPLNISENIAGVVIDYCFNESKFEQSDVEIEHIIASAYQDFLTRQPEDSL